MSSYAGRVFMEGSILEKDIFLVLDHFETPLFEDLVVVMWSDGRIGQFRSKWIVQDHDVEIA